MELSFLTTTMQIMRNKLALLISTAALCCASSAAAQQVPPVRQLGTVMSASAESLSAAVGVRALPGGRVLVNDFVNRRLVMYDSTMRVSRVVADSTSGGANSYGPRPGGMIPFRGDSTLFVDAGSLSMLVIDSDGRVARVMSVPRSQDAFALAGIGGGTPGLDARGRLVYRGANALVMRGGPGSPGSGGGAAGGGAGSFTPEQPDSAVVVRIDLATRQLDTVAFVRVPRPNIQVTRDDAGRMTVRSEVNPLPVVDDWAVMPNGTIALLRGSDYRIDWIHPDGSKSSSDKIPFSWRRLSDEDKVTFMDSVRVARERMLAQQAAGGEGPRSGTVTMGGGGEMMVFRGGPGGDGGGPRGGAPAQRGNATAAAGAAAGGATPQLTFVSPGDLPDYMPPFFANALRVDAAGNLWIRTTAPGEAGAGPVYDVVNARGELMERVQVPAGRAIAAFGPDGSVYLTVRQGSATTLERAKLR